MVLLVLLICAIYVIYLSAGYFLFDAHYYSYGGVDEDTKYDSLPISETEQFILKEIAVTESTYVKKITALFNYLKWLKKYCASYMNDPVKRIVSYYINTIKINDKMVTLPKQFSNYLSSLKFSTELDTYNVCKWLNSNLKEIMDEYIDYATNYEILDSLINYMNENYPDFKDGITDINKSYNPKQDIISSILIVPIQRFPRYRLLLETLSKELNKQIKANPEKDSICEEVNRTLLLCKECNTNFEQTLASYKPPLQSRLVYVLSKLKFPESIMKYGREAGNDIKALQIVTGTVYPSLTKSYSATFYICNFVVFYITGDDVTPIFSNNNVLNPKKIRIIKPEKNIVSFVNEGSLVSTNKYTMLFINENNCNEFIEYIKIKRAG